MFFHPNLKFFWRCAVKQIQVTYEYFVNLITDDKPFLGYKQNL
jgi:hypothetical protein